MKRVLCLLLMLCLVLGSAPVPVYAEEVMETDASQAETTAPEPQASEAETTAPETQASEAETTAPETQAPKAETTIPETQASETESEETEPAEEAVSVTFVCTPEDLTLKVFVALGREREEVLPVSGRTYDLLPGSYSYYAECEGYAPLTAEDLEVDLEAQTVYVNLSPAAEAPMEGTEEPEETVPEETGSVTSGQSAEDSGMITINETNFPSKFFRMTVAQYDTNKDGQLSSEERGRVEVIYERNPVTTFEGLQYFPNVYDFQIRYTFDSRFPEWPQKNLDLSPYTQLESFTCMDAGLVSLKLPDSIQRVYLGGNELTSLDFSNLKALKWIWLNSKYGDMDIRLPKNNNIEKIYISGVHFSSFDPADLQKLSYLCCFNGSLDQITMPRLPALDYLYSENNSITTVDLKNIPGVFIVDLVGDPILNMDISNSSWQGLAEIKCKGVPYSLYAPAKTLDMKAFPGFDPSKVYNMEGFTLDKNGILEITGTTNTLRYCYDCGQGVVIKPEIQLYGWGSAGWEEDSYGWSYKNIFGEYLKSQWLRLNENWYYLDGSGYCLTGLQQIGDDYYYFNSDGRMQTGWQTIRDYYYFFGDDGRMQTGWLSDNGLLYYLEPDGRMATEQWVGDKYMGSNGAWDPNVTSAGWSQDGTGWSYYLADGSYLKDTWKRLDLKWYYFGSDGYMATGWNYLDGHWFYFDANGAMHTGWLTLDGQTYYMNSSGYMCKGWEIIGDHQYHFDDSGVLEKNKWVGDCYVGADGAWETNAEYGTWKEFPGGWCFYLPDGSYAADRWIRTNGDWYYVDANGYMLTGWQQIGGNWRYFDSSGHLLTGWQQIGGNWFYFDPNGRMLTGWNQITGNWFYFDESGHMLTGFQDINGNRFYFNAAGHMLTGWQSIELQKYYFDGSGHMLTGWQELDGSVYCFDAEGRMMTGWQDVDDSRYYFDPTGHYVSGWYQIGGRDYFFRSDGTLVTNEWVGSKYVGADGGWSPDGVFRTWQQDSQGWRYHHRNGGYQKDNWAAQWETVLF